MKKICWRNVNVNKSWTVGVRKCPTVVTHSDSLGVVRYSDANRPE